MPAAGVGWAAMKAPVVNQDFDRHTIAQALKDPSCANVVDQEAALTAFGGGMGIALDAHLTAMSGEPKALVGTAISAMVSTALNAPTVGASVVKGVAGRDTYAFEKVVKTGTHALGEMGRAATNAAESAGARSQPEPKRAAKGRVSSGFDGGYGSGRVS
jgi:hypothetical protein